MRGNNLKLASPRCHRLGHLEKEALVGVQGEFIEDHMAALAGKGVRTRTERIDRPAIRKLKHVARGPFRIQHHFTARIRGDLHGLGPFLAILKEQARLDFVPG